MDNRYFPWIQYPYISVSGRPSHVTGDFFITTASRASDNRDREIGIPEIMGTFDQAQLAFSMKEAGLPIPATFSPLLINAQLPWAVKGKIQAQGFAFSYQQYLGYCFSIGLFGLIMRSNSSMEFFFNQSKASALVDFDIVELDLARRQMFEILGLTCNHVYQAGLGDVDLYARWCQHYEYCLKLRTIDYGLRVGMLLPTGVKHDINMPASVPFGGNGHWGVYASIDGEFEVKEDWKVGFLLRLSKRFAQTQLQRMPVARVQRENTVAESEPQIFGVVVGDARINPGFSQAFFLYAQWEGIREGLGVRVQYTLMNHSKDNWTDERVNKQVAVNIKQMENLSSWASEYFTLSAFYDFGKETKRCIAHPIVRVAWDIPYTLLVAHRFVYSYKVSLGLEFNF